MSPEVPLVSECTIKSCLAVNSDYSVTAAAVTSAPEAPVLIMQKQKATLGALLSPLDQMTQMLAQCPLSLKENVSTRT